MSSPNSLPLQGKTNKLEDITIITAQRLLAPKPNFGFWEVNCEKLDLNTITHFHFYCIHNFAIPRVHIACAPIHGAHLVRFLKVRDLVDRIAWDGNSVPSMWKELIVSFESFTRGVIFNMEMRPWSVIPQPLTINEGQLGQTLSRVFRLNEGSVHFV